MKRSMIATALVLLACSSNPPAPQPPKVMSCEQSCANLERMQCKKFIEVGCIAWCKNAIAGGRRVALECLEFSISCQEAESCR